MKKYVSNYVNTLFSNICNNSDKRINCYLCKNNALFPSIYCKKHEDQLGNLERLKMIRKNGKITLIDAIGGEYEIIGDLVKNLKKSSNIELYKNKMPSKVKQTAGANKKKGSGKGKKKGKKGKKG